MINIILVGALALTASPSSASPDKDSARNSADPERLICRSEPVTGSRLATKRTCLTEAQWAAYERRRNDDATYLQSHRQQTDPR